MSHTHWITHQNEIQPARYQMPLARPAITALLLATCLVACVTDDDGNSSALRRSGIETAAATQMPVAGMDHSVVNRQSATHDSDLRGASIANYDK